MCGAVLIVPLLLTQGGSDASASPTAVGHSSRAQPAGGSHATSSSVPLASVVHPHTATYGAGAWQSQNVAQVTPTTAAVAAPVAPAPTAAPAREVLHLVALSTPPTTATTAPPTTTTLSAVTVPVTATTGQVTYYDHPPGRCASPWLPFGTVVRVTNPANGESVSCVVDDREADTARSIDLATSTFAQIAPLSQGVIDAQLSW